MAVKLLDCNKDEEICDCVTNERTQRTWLEKTYPKKLLG